MGVTAVIKTNTGSLLDKWNEYIKNQDIEWSRKLKTQIEKTVSDHKEPSFTEYYALVLSRYNTLMGEFENFKTTLSEIEPFASGSEKTMIYYYYYFGGTMKHSSKKFKEAIHLYKKAELYLSEIDDQSEWAEFHYKLGCTYHRAANLGLSIKHILQAIELFKGAYAHQRTADCENLLGINNKDLGEYKEAEIHYRNALTYAEMFNNTLRKSTIYHNIGFLYAEQRIFDEAIIYLKKALTFMTEDQKDRKIKTFILLTKVCYEMERLSDAQTWQEQGINLCLEEKDRGYFFRFRMLKALYEPEDGEFEDVFTEGISYFLKQRLSGFVKEYSEILASYYKKNGQYQEASYYYELAINGWEK
jgi:tetratricopeptide (TPR) repeat protein